MPFWLDLATDCSSAPGSAKKVGGAPLARSGDGVGEGDDSCVFEWNPGTETLWEGGFVAITREVFTRIFHINQNRHTFLDGQCRQETPVNLNGSI